ncbi:hypothetical protein [Streptomyces rubradiris]|uniref:Secreted protein n=1 Tax=Streptomyces rubradiris TaxID=285531 RepID=A0ABQ3RBE2_STRRR|nr:hypothetical protein [Streptomyces rubradiris]GHH27820.1 hypothetical protein GCM10018792_70670 [Streptomyces rubradiris]GHI53180.1 hypothetical protein Srubr_30260 [Streptomyces rubradiris]
MIGAWGGGDGSAGRSRRAALLIGLVLVIAAHLTGSVHACSFAGSGPSAVAAGEVVQPADTADGTDPTGPPRHRHAADGHLDHTADRPRAALDDTGLAGEQHPPVLPTVPRGRATHPGWRRPPGVPRDRANGPSLAAVRVLRQ